MIPTPVGMPPPVAQPRRRKPKERVLISDVPWGTYLRMNRALEHKRNVRLAYDRGELEIMTPSFEHDRDADTLGQLVRILTEELGLPIIPGGSVTLKRKAWKKGIEPDRCFWIANAARVSGIRRLDLKIHPPPDLGIEVDVTSSSLNRLAIYARLGVAEVWRLDGDDLVFHQLGAKRRYVASPTSRAFPSVTPAELMDFVKQARTAADQNVVTRAFRAWVRSRASSPPAPPTP